MEKEKLETLKIVRGITEGDNTKSVSIPSIDRRILLVYPQVIYENKLKDILIDLVAEKYLFWANENKSLVKITQKGILQTNN